jgi:hypothetical protein
MGITLVPGCQTGPQVADGVTAGKLVAQAGVLLSQQFVVMTFVVVT